MREIDQTKNSLKTGNMDAKVKREMFDKFKQIGGQVYVDKPSKKDDGSKSSKVINRGKTSSGGNERVSTGNASLSVEARRRQLIELDKANSETFFNRIIVKVKARFGSVANFSGDISVQLIKRVNSELSKTFFDLKLLQKNISPKAIEILKNDIPIYQFLLRQLFSLYKPDIFQDIQQQFKFTSGSYADSSHFKKSFYYIFKRLYLLYSYQKTIDKLLVIILKNLQDQKAKILYKNLRKDFNTLYSYFFESLYLFVITVEQKNIPIISMLMEDTLSITEEEKVDGFLSDEKEEDYSQEEVVLTQEDELSEDEESSEENQNIFLENGLELINAKSIMTKKTNYLLKKEIEEFEDEDPNYVIYLTFKEFDLEYSPIFTTNQIQVNKKLELVSKNMSYDTFLNSIYDSLISVSKEFEKYKQVKGDYNEFKTKKPSNYIIAAKKESEFSAQVSNKSMAFKHSLKNILKDSIFIFESMVKNIEDEEIEEKIILNPLDILSIESNYDSVFSQKSIKDAIIETYSFCIAFLHKIENNQF